MNDLKPIETKYKDCLFRSRLEARWAVYFDYLDIKWYYEYEGFELPSGKRYLPDFYLPDHEIFCEVKPYKQLDERWVEFVRGSNRELVILSGEPNNNLEVFGSRKSYKPCSAQCNPRSLFGCNKALFEHESIDEVYNIDAFILPPNEKYFPLYYGDFFYTETSFLMDSNGLGRKYQRAIEAAKSARF